MYETSNNKWREPKYVIRLASFFIAGAITLWAVLSFASSVLSMRINSNYPPREVSVAGQGKVSYVPDIVNVTLGVQIDKAQKADEALNQLNDRVNKIVAAVKKSGIVDEDIQTQNYSLYPQYDMIKDVSTVTGYNANQQLTIKIKDYKIGSDRVSKVIAEATKAGANQVAGISFDSSKANELKQEARIRAIEDAKGKAGNIAQAAGIRSGDIAGWWENIIQAPGVANTYYDGKGGVGGGPMASPSVPTGTQEVVVEISLNYKIR